MRLMRKKGFEEAFVVGLKGKDRFWYKLNLGFFKQDNQVLILKNKISISKKL
jgi:hypothetical protein